MTRTNTTSTARRRRPIEVVPLDLEMEQPTLCHALRVIEAAQAILNRVAIRQALDDLEAFDRTIVEMTYALERPADYDGPWPATREAIVQYLEAKYPEQSASMATVSRILARIRAGWRNETGR